MKYRKILIAARSVGSTSGSWNNIYGIARRNYPGAFLPPLRVVWSLKPKVRFGNECADGEMRRFLNVSLLSAVVVIRRLARRQAQQGSFLVLHIQNASLFALVVLAFLAGSRFRLVYTQRNEWCSFNFGQKFNLSLLVLFSSAYVYCGKGIEQTAPVWVKIWLQLVGKGNVIANGIPASKFAAMDATYPVNCAGPSEVASAIIIARMVPQKNPFFLLELVARSPMLTIIKWYGEGPLRAQIESKISDLGLCGRLILLGKRPREEVFDALKQATFYITASRWEGLSVADLEAIALGCWPIMSDIPQRHEVRDATGISLLPLNDITKWSDAMQEFLNRSEVEKAALKSVLKMRARAAFDRETSLNHYMKVYRA